MVSEKKLKRGENADIKGGRLALGSRGVRRTVRGWKGSGQGKGSGGKVVKIPRRREGRKSRKKRRAGQEGKEAAWEGPGGDRKALATKERLS